MEFDERSIEASGLNFTGPAAGSGRPVLLLHGFPDTPRTFTHQINALADAGFEVFAPAMRGYPPTGGGAPDSIAELGDDVVALAEAVAARSDTPVDVVGHDWGGIATMTAAASESDVLGRIAILSVPHPTSLAGRFFAGDFDQLRRSWYMFFFQQPIAEAAIAAGDFAFIDRLVDEWSPGYSTGAGKENLEALKRCFSEPGALGAAIGYYRSMFARPAIVGPVGNDSLVIFGANDGCIAPEVCDGMAGLFTGRYRFEVVEGAGHFVHAEQPDVVNQMLIEFLTTP